MDDTRKKNVGGKVTYSEPLIKKEIINFWLIIYQQSHRKISIVKVLFQVLIYYGPYEL